MKRRINLILFSAALLTVSLTLQAQTLLSPPVPPRLVNDIAGVLQASEVQALEDKLVAFSDSTSNQIAVVIVDDLKGYDKSEFAYIVAKEWGIGQADFNNGLVVLVKTKSASSDGQIFIATGYGLEGPIPDIACADIIDREILPRFMKGDYYGGLNAGTDVLMSLASGEFSYADYGKQGGSGSSGSVPVIVFIIFIIGIILLSSGNSNNKQLRRSGTSSLPFWLLMGMMGSGKSHGGSWGGFTGGGSSGSGGFGGFGGGGFGGGGAGGSW
ncbi:MAG TPA: TPM domain-containing protein [Bacteroidales bacterium]|nr:TPM domain-containing protein [Bacteroidales bacterium]